MAYRTLVTDFSLTKKCDTCDIELSSSHWDTKPLAIVIRKNKTIRYTHAKFQCVSCAIKGNYLGKTTIEQIQKFFHLDNLKEESSHV